MRLGRLSSRKDLDITEAGHINKLSSEEIVERIVAGKSVDLLRTLSARDEDANLLDRSLNKIYREVATIYEETGAYDLFLGYPFVEGKFLDGTIVRCPLLLFPVRLERNFQQSPRWKLTVSDEEDVAFNRTFFLAYEKFQQVRLSPEFWDTPLDHHPDLQDFLNWLFAFFKQHELQINFNSEAFTNKVSRFVPKNKDLLDQLSVGLLKRQPNAVLGIFPQSDSALLQDYELMEQDAETFSLEKIFAAQPELPSNTYVKEDERYFVTPVDQSQEEALLKVRHGQSVVVHGPPGTGKSQVILNLIADALAQGKKVLVCSQKRAALDVVYHRLHEIGLSRFAALVHDYRGDRNKIFQHIRRQIEDIESFAEERRDLNLDKWMRDFRHDARRIDEFNHTFEDLWKALSEPGRFGMSAHQMYLAADSKMPFPGSIAIGMGSQARNFDRDSMQDFLVRLRDLIRYAEFYHPEAPWKERLSFHTLGFNARERLRKQISELPGQIETLRTASEKVRFLDEPFRHPEEIEAVLTAYRELQERFEQPGVTENYAHYEGQELNMSQARSALEKLERIFLRMKEFRILNDFSMLLFMDLAEHYANYEEKRNSAGRFFSMNWIRGRWYIKRILTDKGLKYKDENIRALKKELDVLQRLMDRYRELEKDHFFADLPLTDSPDKLLKWHESKLYAIETVKMVRAVKLAPALKPQIHGLDWDGAHWEGVQRTLTDLDSLRDLLTETRRSWRSWLHEAQTDRLAEGMFEPAAAKNYAEDLGTSLERDFEDLRSLDLLLQEFSPNEKAVLELLEESIGTLESGRETAFLKEVENGFYMAWIELTEAEKPVLGEVSSRRMPRMREEFQEKVKERQQKAILVILHKLKSEILNNIEYNRLNNPVTYRDIGHQVRKKRLLWSVRRLVNEYWEGSLSKLMPCWLASPESVAAIFPMKQGWFDLVIFDEASQCYVERALPVILRGKNCVIAGDDKQLPPFDLYNVKVEDFEEAFADNEMAMEVESALDLARNLFSESKLNWHYRSREEELINFSNHAFYEGRLNIIPPAQSLPEFQPPIEFRRVQGLWEKNSNEAEARHILELVEELIQRPDNPSIGIVTFNYHQKELIRDLLEGRLQELGSSAGNPALLSLFTAALDRTEEEEYQGIFVKNIENVQGDERDIIIFSVGYARNAEGRLVANFGLLSQRGGENRLNVAITRARNKVYVVCSFEPEELKVEGATHAGPPLFKRYLQYARAVSEGRTEDVNHLLQQLSDSNATEQSATPGFPGEKNLADHLFEALTAKGLKLARDVGDTNYKVDLAVMDDSGAFLLGIECEGRNYFNGRSSKEREVYRLGLMTVRGWQVYRVWARNYFLNPEAVVAEILALIENADSAKG